MKPPLFVLSDLHIAAPGPLNNFHAGPELVRFLRALPDGATLVLAGDFLDFLQQERPPVLDLAGAPALIEGLLASLAEEEWGAALFAALGDFVGREGHCVVLPGNHDPELHHPEAGPLLRCAAGLDAAEERLEMFVQPGPWTARRGPWEVVIGHGHRPDPWNDIDPVRVHAALERGEASLPLPPGSLLVLQALNAFKEARDPATGALRFPFVDLLKPETPWVPLLLLYLDPLLALRSSPAFFGNAGRPLVRALKERLLRGPSLAPGARPSDLDSSPAALLADAIATSLPESEIWAPEAVLAWLSAWLEGGPAPGEGRLAAHGGGRLLARAALARLVRENTFFAPGQPSPHDDRILADHLAGETGLRVVLAGHTHAERDIRLPGDRVYLNTGTWTDLIAVPSFLKREGWKGWIDALESNRLPRLRRLPYAKITEDGPRLLHWAEPSSPHPGPQS